MSEQEAEEAIVRGPSSTGLEERPAPAPNLLRRILGGSVNYGLGGVLPQLLNFLLIPVYTRFLTPEDYGIADVASSVGAVLTIIVRLGVAGSVTRFYYDHKQGEALNRFISTVTAFLAGWGLVAGVILTVAGPAIFRLIAPGIDFFPYLALAVWTAVLGIHMEVQQRLLQAQERSRTHMLLTTSQFALGLVLTILFVVVLDLRVLGVLLGTFVSTAVFFLVAVGFLARYWTWSWCRTMLREAIAYGLPMLPHHVFTWLTTLASRLFLNGLGTTAAVGLFGIASRMASPLNIALTALNAAWVPVYFSLRKSGSEDASETLGRAVTALAAMVVWCALGIAVLGPEVVMFMTPREYHSSGGLLPILAAAHLVRGCYFVVVSGAFFEKRTSFVPMATGLGAIVSVATCLYLIPRRGAEGAAVAVFAGNVATFGAVVAMVGRLTAIRFEWGRLAAFFLIAAGFFVAFRHASVQGTAPRLFLASFFLVAFPAIAVYSLAGGVKGLGKLIADRAAWRALVNGRPL